MAKRGTSKRFSVEQEEHIAKLYNGVRSKSSGAADNDSGDVRSKTELIECKVTRIQPNLNGTNLMAIFEKIAKEAYAEGRSPVVALRFLCPDSILADPHGWVDLSVRLSEEDAIYQSYYHGYSE